MRFVAAILTFFLCELSLAEGGDSHYEPDYTVVENNVVYDIEEGGSFVYREDFVLRINNQAGVEKMSQFPLPFSDSLQELQVVEAYTTTADGERLDVGDDGIYTQQSPVSNRAPAFSDFKIQYIVFPGVEPGATLHLSFERTQVKPLFPGEFSTIEIFDVTQEYRSGQLTVIAPASYTLHIEAIDIEGGEIPSDTGGQKMWRWNVSDTDAHVPEMGSVGMIDVSPRVVISSFSEYREIASAYLAQADAKAKPTPKIQKLADKVTKGIDDKRLQAEALYNWVAENIRYVAIFIEYGGVVPREAETVLNTRYGDCKDHVVLLQALLSAKNIESNQVLVNAVNNFWLPEVAAPDMFNHAITYVPELDLYMDATLKFAPFGVLSPLEVGKKALVTSSDSTQSRLATIPWDGGAMGNIEEVLTEVDIPSSGDATLNRTIKSSGAMEFAARARLSQMPRGRGKQIVSAMLKQMGQNGSGDVKIGDAHDLDEPFAYSYELEFPDYVSLENPGAFSEPVGVPSMSGISNLAASLAMENRDFPIPCVGGLRKETTVINIPDDVVITALPKPKRIANDYGRYLSSYEAEQGRIRIDRSLDLDLPPVCDSETYTTLRNMAVDIALDLRERISYQ